MYETYKLTNWLVAREGCPISYAMHSSNDVDFILGDQASNFELCLEVGALREFVRLGSQALGEVDALRAAEEEEEKKNKKTPTTDPESSE